VRIGRGMLIRVCVIIIAVGVYFWLTYGLIPHVPQGCFSEAYTNVALHAAQCNLIALEYHQAQSTQEWLTWGLVAILAFTAIPTRFWELLMARDTI